MTSPAVTTNTPATDVRLMSELGLGAYRFSISWPRVIPGGRGDVAPSGIDFYDRLVDQLLAAGIEPYVTLYHWDLPQALEDDGGWPERATAYHFAEYADVVAAALGDRVKHWATLNEPYCASHFGYVTGFMAPGRHVGRRRICRRPSSSARPWPRRRTATRPCPRCRSRHRLELQPDAPGERRPGRRRRRPAKHALHNRWFAEPIAGLGYPIDDTGDDRWSGAELHDGDLDIIAAPIDVLGVNYYSRALVNAADDRIEPPGPVTAMGWEIYPQGLAETLRWLHERCGFPRYLITENGAAMDDHPDAAGFVDDQDRIAYLRDHLAVVHELIAEGVPVGGYFAWSLMDNFEWAYGYTQRFGLIRVDYDTLERTRRRARTGTPASPAPTPI